MKELTLVKRSILDICVFGIVLLLNILAFIIINSFYFEVSSIVISAIALLISVWLLIAKKERRDEATNITFASAAVFTLLFTLITLIIVAVILVFEPTIIITYKLTYMYVALILIVFNAAIIRLETRGIKRGFCDE